MLSLLLLAAFEWTVPFGAEAGMMAGAAFPDWRHASRTNPMALVHTDRVAVTLAYTEPYGLKTVAAGGGGAVWRVHSAAMGVMFSSLASGSYHEFNPCAGLALVLPCSLGAGLGLHGLVVSDAAMGLHFAPALDLGLGWSKGAFHLTAGVRRLNQPCFENGDELAAQFFGGLVWRPGSHLALAADVERTQEYELVRLGMVFEPISVLCLRGGVCTYPLSYAAGAALSAGQLAFDYAFRFHPCLGGTHLLGVSWGPR